MSGHGRASVRGRKRVVIVDDHPLVREGLVARISAQPDLEVCGEGADPQDALELVRVLSPDLLLLDLAFKRGNGLDVIRELAARGAGPQVLVVSAYEEELLAERVLRCGAHGYLNKQELQGSVIEAIQVVLRGETYLSRELAKRLSSRPASERRPARGVDALTDRERQVFEFIGRGLGTRAIADKLNLSVHTIESHRENIRAKLGLRNGAELLRRAVLSQLEGLGST